MRTTVGAVLAAAALTAGCSTAPPDSAPAGTVTVFAAASLQSVFTTLGERFEKARPGTAVRFNFAGSSDLAAQLVQGAPADVFAAADTTTMAEVVEAGIVRGDPKTFATNTLTIVTPRGNPAGVQTFADLADLEVVVCAPQVPCGAATDRLEQVTGVTLTPVSEESAVTDVLGKVTSGQADAGLVYLTDAARAGDTVTAVAVPEAGAVVNTYPIAVLADSAHTAAAADFVDLITGREGREVLTAAGFGVP